MKVRHLARRPADAGVHLIAVGAFFSSDRRLPRHSRRLAVHTRRRRRPPRLASASSRRSGLRSLESPASSQSDFAFMGGVPGWRDAGFPGGYATGGNGRVELDLRGAKIANSPAVLDVFALWGGVELPFRRTEGRHPGVPFSRRREQGRAIAPPAGGPEQVLIVRGTALMGVRRDQELGLAMSALHRSSRERGDWRLSYRSRFRSPRF